MNLAMAIEHGKRVGVRFYVMNDKNCIMGGTQTREQAEDMKLRFEAADRTNPWTKGTTRFYIKPV
ncbi:MAG: hypothetical protein IKJ26_04995 [Clostridia bacterium]|nr:hypothetical protein [Clostridia bacterium]